MLATYSAAADTSLGISAKSSHTIGELKPNLNTTLEARQKRYTLQRTAQSILYDSSARKQHRVCSCHRNVASDGVPVFRAIDGGDARLGNLITCGSVWSCPVCNAKITESRRVDMQKAVSGWILQGGCCLLNTLTFPHEADMPLSELNEKFSYALDLYKKSRTYNRIFGSAVASIDQRIKLGKPLKSIKDGEFPRLGSVRSLEVTHGVNGWHPHVHEVHFMQDDALLKALSAQDELTALWVKCLLDAGLGDSSKVNDMLLRAWDIRGGDFVSDYINKFGREPVSIKGWTIASEATKANSKINLKGAVGKKVGTDWHFTPFQLLGFATDGDTKSAELFKEFSICFEGKRMNYWTNGLKDWFKINEVDDEALAEDEPQKVEEEFVCRLSVEQWKLVLETNTRNELLTVAAKEGNEGVQRLLVELKGREKTHSGWFNDRARPDITRFFH